jgi:hypothetical protein
MSRALPSGFDLIDPDTFENGVPLRHMELLGSADVVEAAVAFMEKRPPLFRGL